jgi:hypothetical protein
MFGFSKRRKYRHEVLGGLYALLYLYPRGRDKIIKDFPGVAGLIRAKYYPQGIPPQRAALLLATVILTKLAEALTAEERALIAQQLAHLEIRKIHSIAQDVTAGKALPSELAFGAIMFGHSIVMARALVDDREVEQFDYDMFVSEVFGVFAGQSSEQRSSGRFSTFLEQVTPRGRVLEAAHDGSRARGG